MTFGNLMLKAKFDYFTPLAENNMVACEKVSIASYRVIAPQEIYRVQRRYQMAVYNWNSGEVHA
jgi:hypothetical protein